MTKTTMMRSAWMALACSVAFAAHAEGLQRIEVPAGDIVVALEILSKQVDIELVFQAKELKGIHTEGARGTYAPQEAVAALLKGTSLSMYTDSSGAMFISSVSETGKLKERRDAKPTADTATIGALRLAQADANPPAGHKGNGEVSNLDSEASSLEKLEEVVVTGTHIRGAPPPSRVIQIDREQIRNSGFSTTEQLLQSLPQNFGAGNTAAAVGGTASGPGANNNFAGGSGINLRGLGNSSTLVLLNGRRLAPAGVGDFVDLSLIPLALIDHIDVLTDGASATYGADAVGGVVNVILKQKYDAAETRLRYGAVTDGAYDEQQFDQTLGRTWASGSALFGFDYAKNSNLAAADREFTENAPVPTDLIGHSTRRSIIGSVSQDITPRLVLHGDALYSKRHTTTDNNVPEGNLSSSDSEVEQYGLALGAGVKITDDWHADLDALYSRNQSDNVIFDAPTATRARMRSIDLRVDGPLFALGGGQAKIAIGGQYRREGFTGEAGTVTPGELSRTARAVFAEMRFPFIGIENARRGLEKLDLTLAARHDSYSDFGSSTNPKIAMAWSPADGFYFRGTYGESFRAPTFFELSEEAFSTTIALDAQDPLSPPGATVPVVFLLGNNSDLQPETSRTWTAGFDIAPASVPRFKFSVSYFDIDFKDRIVEAFPSFLYYNALTDPSVAPVVDSQPSPAAVTELFARSNFLNFTAGGAQPGDIAAIVDDRLNNLASTRESGIDVAVEHGFETRVGIFDARLDASYLFTFDSQVTASAATQSRVGTIFFPVDLRARASATWRRNRTGAALFFNYTDSYRDDRTEPQLPVASWMTSDLTLSYDFAREGNSTLPKDIRFAFSALNLFDRRPPFVENIYGIGFDPINASAMGRFLSLTMETRW